MNIDLKIFTKELLKSNGIKKSTDKTNKLDKIDKILSIYLEVLLFTIISLLAVLCIFDNSKTIKKSYVCFVNKYIKNLCSCNKNSKITGGCTGMPLEYYGINSNNYIDNAGSDILKVNWEAGILRPAINNTEFKGGSNGKSKKQNTIKIYIIKLLNYYKLKVSKNTVNELFKIFKCHLNCIINMIKNNKNCYHIISKSRIMKTIKK
jgi:hypothetical protein